MKRILSFCLLCLCVFASTAQPRFGTMPQGAPPVPAPRPAFVPPPVAAPSFGSGGWSSPPPVAAPVQNWTPPQNGAPHIAAPVFGGPTPWNAPIAVPQPFGQGQSFSPAPVVAAPVFVPPVVQPQVQRPAIDAPIPQAIYSPSIAPNLAQPLPSDRVTAPRLETPTSSQSIAPILSGPVVPRAPPQTGYTITARGGSPSTSLSTVFPQDSLSGRTPASSRFLSAPSDTTANPQSTSALAQGFLKEVPGQTKNAVIGTGEGVWEGLVNTAKVVGQVPGLVKDLQVAGYSPSTYRQAYAEVKAVSTDPSVRQYYANTVTTATQNLVSGTTAAAQRWFQSTDAREPSRAIASATTQAVIGELVGGATAAKNLVKVPIAPEAINTIKDFKQFTQTVTSSATKQAIAEAKNVIEVPVGRTGNWEKNINPGTTGTLSPNTLYKLSNGQNFVTDNKGRVIETTANPSLGEMDRNKYQQRCAAANGCSGDEGAHLVAASLGGAGDGINLIPMSATLNRSDWRAMERELTKYLQEGRKVDLKITLEYSAMDTARPSNFLIEANVDGRILRYPFSQ